MSEFKNEKRSIRYDFTAQCNKLSNQVSDGFEYRDVDCDIEYHKPSQGRKKITRKDSGISWDEKMHDWEWNLFNQPDEELPSKKSRKKK